MKADAKEEKAILQRLTDEEFDFIAVLDIEHETIDFRTVNSHANPPLAKGIHPYAEAADGFFRGALPSAELEKCRRDVTLQKVIGELDRHGAYSCGTAIRSPNGEYTRKQFRFYYLDEQKTEILLLETDITDYYEHEIDRIQKLQAALLSEEKANVSRSEFLSSISHDMRTPLNGIIGFTNLALGTDSQGSIRDYLNKIKISGSLLLDLVNDTLTLSRIQSGKLFINLEPSSNYDIIDHIAVPMRAAAEEKGLHFVLETEGLPQRRIMADRSSLQKIFLNLLSNAVKFTPEGGTVEFEIGEIPQTPEGWNCRAIVRDTGIGMSPRFMKVMYDPFTQEHPNEPADGQPGTGLGLSIVRQLVNLLGGNITAKSSPGSGSEFTVYLHIDPAGPEEKAKAVSTQPDSEFKGRKVLVCEDNYLNMEIARTLLEKRGLTVICASDGRDGLEKFSASDPGEFDAILMDLRMPVMNGYDAAEAIRALPRPDAGSVPIIAMTADAYAEDIRKCYESGMNGHVPKPIDPTMLFRQLSEHWKTEK